MFKQKLSLFKITSVVVALFILGKAQCSFAENAYNPLRIPDRHTYTISDLSIHDSRRQRDIPIRLYLPDTAATSPLILFSPGLGGSRTGYAYLAKHWALRGYAVVVMQHPGSDNRIWQGKPKSQAIAAMRHAANGQNFLARTFDVKTVLNRLSQWDHDNSHRLAGRFDLSRIGMAGHSFGAVTSEAVSGEQFRGRALFTDPRIRAALLLSPSSPRHGTATAAFADVSIPWMTMTGTRDIGLLGLGARSVKSRLAVYSALPPGDKYELVLAGAQHMAFSDRPIMDSRDQRDPNDHRAIIAISTAFWDAQLRHLSAARSWLKHSAVSVLKPGDQWYRK